MGKIIVVDDEPKLRKILVQALCDHGFEVTDCPSGLEALAELRQKEFDLLLTDLMMPEMDGIALLEAALKIDQNLIGIVMTGEGTIQTAVDAMKLGAFDYVLKPFRLQAMMPVLTRAINTRRLRMENLQLRETFSAGWQMRHYSRATQTKSPFFCPRGTVRNSTLPPYEETCASVCSGKGFHSRRAYPVGLRGNAFL